MCLPHRSGVFRAERPRYSRRAGCSSTSYHATCGETLVKPSNISKTDHIGETAEKYSTVALPRKGKSSPSLPASLHDLLS